MMFLPKNWAAGLSAGGIITLTLERADRQARLVVSNPGDPIPAEHLPHLFERFYRSDASRGEKSGFGLGLSIADSIVREHRGKIWAESAKNINTFFVQLPLTSAQPTPVIPAMRRVLLIRPVVGSSSISQIMATAVMEVA